MDIASLGLRIQSTDAVTAKQNLDNLAASGQKAEQQLTASTSKMSQAIQAQARTVQTAVQSQSAAVREAYAAWQRGEASLNDERLLRHVGIIKQTTQDYYALANAERVALEAQLAKIRADEAATVAATANANATRAATGAQQLHGLQLGRLNQELGTFIGRLTGTNTAVTRLAGQIGGAVLGYGSMIAVLGGVTLAIGAAEAIYNKFTEASRKAREENERLLKVLDEIAKRRGTTEISTNAAAVAAGQARLADLRAQLAGAEAAARSTGARGFAGGGAGLAGLQTPFSEAQARQIDELRGKVASAEAELTALVRRGAEERDRVITSDLANIVKSGQATAAQITSAKALLAGYEQSLTALQKAHSGDTATIVDLIDKIKQLNDALNPKQRVSAGAGVTGPTVEQKAVLDGLLKQLDAMRKVDDENHREDASARAAAEAVGIQGAQLEILNAKRKAELDTLAAYQQYSGPALTDRLNQIKATEDQTIATAKVKQRFEEAKESQKLWTDAQKEANRIAQQNIKTTQEQDAATAAAIKKQQDYAREMRAIWQDGLAKIITDGTKSFRDFFEDVLRLFTRLMDRMQKEGKDSGFGFKALQVGTAAIGAGVAGYQSGYSIGSSTPGLGYAGSAVTGAAAGAIGGAAIGSAVLPGVGTAIGAVVGATAGLIGGLLGHAAAAKQAKEAEQAIRLSYQQSITAYKEAIGVISPITGQLQQNKEQADALRAAIEKGYAGTKNQAEREAKLAEVNKLEAQGAQKIANDFWKSVDQGLNALQGPAGAYQNALAQEDEAYKKNLQSATDLGATEDQLDKIRQLHTETVARLAAAEAERLAQLQLSLDARQAYALGLTDEGQAIERKAQEEKELFDATQNGYTDAQIAQLKYIQGLEDEAAAKKKLADANQTLAENIAAGPTGTIVDRHKAELQPLLDKQAADTIAYNAAVDKLNTDILAGANAATVAADKQAVMTAGIVSAGDAAGIAAKQFQQAAEMMDQSASQIEQDVAFGVTSGQQGLDYLKQAFGFVGLTDDQIRNMYTAFSGAPLSNEQIQTNKNVETYFRDLKQFGVGGVGGPGGAAAQQAGASSATANAARALSEYTGNRMADYLASILIVERQQLDVWTGRSNLSPPPSLSAPNARLSASGLTSGDVDKLLLGIQSTATKSSAPTVQVNVSIAPSATENPDVYARRVATEVAKKVEELLAEQYSDAQIRSGSTLKIGA